MDESHDPFVGDDKLFEKRATEMQKKLTRRDGSTMTLAQSKRASELQKDIHAWEENRLFRSGVVRAREVRAPVSHPVAAMFTDMHNRCSRHAMSCYWHAVRSHSLPQLCLMYLYSGLCFSARCLRTYLALSDTNALAFIGSH